MTRSLYILIFFLISPKTGFDFAQISASPAVATNSDPLLKLSQQFENLQRQLNSIEDQLKNLQTSINQKAFSDDSMCVIRDIVESIKVHKFRPAEEKLIQLIDKNKISNIVHDVYADSPVNGDIILDFAKVLTDSDSQYRFFSALRDEITSSGHNDPFKLINLVEAMEREMARQRNASPEIKDKTQNVIDKTINDVKVSAINIFKNAMITDKYQNNREVENLASALFHFRTNVSNEVMEHVVDNVFGVVAAEKILNNIGSHSNIPQAIIGLTAIFNRFNFAGNLNNAAMLDLASRLHELQLREKYSLVTQELRDDVEKLIQQLPNCARNLFFYTNVCLWNKGRGEYLYAASTSISFDAERRSIFTWYPGDIQTGAYWFVEKIEGHFFFKNRDHVDEYMYAVANDFENDYNKDMRYVFNWIPGKNTDPQSRWTIELDGEYCYIKSSLFNEYLFASSVRYDQFNSYVFTWKPGTSVRSAEFQWQIRNCGQERKG